MAPTHGHHSTPHSAPVHHATPHHSAPVHHSTPHHSAPHSSHDNSPPSLYEEMTDMPTEEPTEEPTLEPTEEPTLEPTEDSTIIDNTTNVTLEDQYTVLYYTVSGFTTCPTEGAISADAISGFISAFSTAPVPVNSNTVSFENYKCYDNDSGNRIVRRLQAGVTVTYYIKITTSGDFLSSNLGITDSYQALQVLKGFGNMVTSGGGISLYETALSGILGFTVLVESVTATFNEVDLSSPYPIFKYYHYYNNQVSNSPTPVEVTDTRKLSSTCINTYGQIGYSSCHHTSDCCNPSAECAHGFCHLECTKPTTGQTHHAGDASKVTIPTFAPSASTNTGASSSSSSSSSDGLSDGAIAGIIIGVLGFVGLTVVMGYYFAGASKGGLSTNVSA